MIIDCDSCAVRGSGCADCVVTALLGPGGAEPSGPAPIPLPVLAAATDAGVVELDEEEQQALAVLARAGLVAPLRLSVVDGSPPGPPGARSGAGGPGDTPTRRRAV